jgi:hypothetical protein
MKCVEEVYTRIESFWRLVIKSVYNFTMVPERTLLDMSVPKRRLFQSCIIEMGLLHFILTTVWISALCLFLYTKNFEYRHIYGKTEYTIFPDNNTLSFLSACITIKLTAYCILILLHPAELMVSF